MAYWQHYEHEADIGIEGIGNSREEAFSQAALALTAVITEPEQVLPISEIRISCKAPNLELLFVDWLNALVYEMATRKMLFSQFGLTIFPTPQGQLSLQAKIRGEKIDLKKHQPVVEVKGATYTTLQVYEDSDHNWHAQTVVDV
jgi:tRNA nucleotidyltransferase (CCA-adding enzyme)